MQSRDRCCNLCFDEMRLRMQSPVLLKLESYSGMGQNSFESQIETERPRMEKMCPSSSDGRLRLLREWGGERCQAVRQEKEKNGHGWDPRQFHCSSGGPVGFWFINPLPQIALRYIIGVKMPPMGCITKALYNPKYRCHPSAFLSRKPKLIPPIAREGTRLPLTVHIKGALSQTKGGNTPSGKPSNAKKTAS